MPPRRCVILSLSLLLEAAGAWSSPKGDRAGRPSGGAPAAGAFGDWYSRGSPVSTEDELMQRARAARFKKDYAMSLELAMEVILGEPNHAQARQLLREVATDMAQAQIDEVQRRRRALLQQALGRPLPPENAAAEPPVPASKIPAAAQALPKGVNPPKAAAEAPSIIEPLIGPPKMPRRGRGRSPTVPGATRGLRERPGRQAAEKAPRRPGPAPRAPAQAAPVLARTTPASTPPLSDEEAMARFEQAADAERRGEHLAAVGLLSKILERRPEHEPTRALRETLRNKYAREHYITGLMHYGRGNLKGAIQEWKKGLEIKPDDERARKALERARKELEAKP